MVYKAANSAVARLISAVNNSSDFTFSVEAGYGADFAALGVGDYCYVKLQKANGTFEIWKITSIVGDVFSAGSTANRAQQGTALTAFSVGDIVECTWTKEDAEATKQTADSTAIAALVPLTAAADRLPYYTGGTTAALTTFTAFARTLMDDADAATARATLNAASLASNTFTASQTINGTSGTASLTLTAAGNANALTATGSGTGDGISGTGGATNGRGVVGTGVGTGIGGDFVGGSGSANAHGARGTAVHASAGGVSGFSQNGSFWGVLGYQNAYGMYSNGLARVVGSIQLDGGHVYLNAAQTRFLQWMSDQYVLQGAPLFVSGLVSSGSYFQSADAISLATTGGAEGLVVAGGFRVNSGSNQYGQYVSNATWTLVATVAESVTYDVYTNHGRGIYVAIKGGGDSIVAFLGWEHNSTFTMTAAMGAVATMGAYRYVFANFSNDSVNIYKVT